MSGGSGSASAVFYADRYHPVQAGSIDGTDVAPHDNAVLRALICSQAGLCARPPLPPPPRAARLLLLFLLLLSPAFGLPLRCRRPVRRPQGHRRPLLHGLRRPPLPPHRRRHAPEGDEQVWEGEEHAAGARHWFTGASRGYAFVEYETDREMRRAYEDAHHSIIDGSEVIVDYYRQQLMPGWIPRRLGGGLGGKKESGQLRFGGRERPFRAPLRPIPYDELKKLGIPPPPEGRYMSRYQQFPRHRGVKAALSTGKIHLLGEDPGTEQLIVATEGIEVQLKTMNPPTGGKPAMINGKNHKPEEVQDHPPLGRTGATAGRGLMTMTIIIRSGGKAESWAKYLQRRMVATEENELRPNQVGALVGPVTTTGITGTRRMIAGSPVIETAGITMTGVTVIVITTREVRAEIIVTLIATREVILEIIVTTITEIILARSPVSFTDVSECKI
ncbi:hypothetical protein ACP4OV_023399 [Aristida adscensionis]